MASQIKPGGLSAWQAIALRAGATLDHFLKNEIVKVRSASTSPTNSSALTTQASLFTTALASSEHQQQRQLPLRLYSTPDPPITRKSATPSDSVVMAADRKTERQIGDPSLQSLTQFMNANLIHQKRLKANHSQITMVTIQFIELKAKYEPNFTSPPSTTSAIRARMYEELRKFCTRHDNLLELRRQILQKQLAWLEAALDAPVLKDSMQLGFAIDMQVEAAKELAELQKDAKLKRALEALW